MHAHQNESLPSKRSLAITGIGIVSSLGDNTIQSISALRADLTRMRDIELLDHMDRPIVGAPIESVTTRQIGEKRVWQIAAMASAEALRRARLFKYLSPRLRIAVLWSTQAEMRPGFDLRLHETDRQHFLEQVGIHNCEIIWKEFPAGNASALVALKTARDLLLMKRADVCLVGASDSLLTTKTLQWLEAENRLKTEDNTDGLVPGEAAAFVAVESLEAAKLRAAEVWALIAGIGLGKESNTITSENPCLAQGLTAAIRKAVDEAGVSSKDFLNIYCDMNGEVYRAREWAFAMLRGLRETRDDLELLHPADCLGDIGAASGSLLLGASASALRLGHCASPVTMVWSSSETTDRAAVVLQAPMIERYRCVKGMPVLREAEDEDSISHSANPSTDEASIMPAKDFDRGIFLELLDDSSFLYEQRVTLLDDPEVTWLDVGDFEERMLANVDALAINGSRSISILKKNLKSGDIGEIYIAVLSLCCMSFEDSLISVVEMFKQAGEEKLMPWRDALCVAPHPHIKNIVISFLDHKDPLVQSAAMWILGYRRIPSGEEIIDVLKGQEPDMTAIWALGRLRERTAQGILFSHLQHEDESVRSVAALALLRIGEPETVRLCLPLAESEDWALLPLGLGGGLSAVSTLLNIASDNKASPNCLTALGLLGDISAIETLIAGLSNEDLAESAAIALNLITGAGLYEEVFIPEEIDEDELFEEELEKLKKGEPLYPPGEEPGTTITRISQKQEEWQTWWEENKSRFNPGIRYRNGKPYSPACLLENLQSEKSPRLVRQLAYEELVIRYSVDFPFETDMFVTQQKQAIAQYAQWVETNASRFREGDWYFAGQPMPE